MTGIKRLGTWEPNPFGTIWHTENYENADKCLMCAHMIPHSLKEHEMVLAKWPAPKALKKKAPRQIHKKYTLDPQKQQEGQRTQRERRKWKRQVWATV